MKSIIATSKVDHLILLAGLLISVFLVVLGINRGFDISDEGLYALFADPNQENSYGLTYYDLFFKLLYQLFQIRFSVIELRLIRLISVILGAWFIASWAKRRNPQFSGLEWYLISALGLFISYSFLPQTLSYNSLALFFVSAWLYSLDEKYKLLKSLKLGLLLALLLYVKATVALGLGLVTMGLILYESKVSWSALKQGIGLVIPFLALETLFQFFLNDSFFALFEQSWNGPISRTDYDLAHLVKINLVGWFWVLLLFIPWLLVGKFTKPILWGIALTSSLVVAWLTHITDEWNHLVLVFIISVLGYVFGRFRERVTTHHLLLVALPFILHLGSNVYFFRLGIFFSCFWILAIFGISNRNFTPFNLTIFTSTAVFCVFLGVWWKPFGLEQPLWQSNSVYQVPNNSIILLDEELLGCLSEMPSYLNNDSQFLSIYRNPGISFLLGKNIPFSPGFWDKASLMDSWNLDNKPSFLIYQSIDSLPDSWHYSDTLGSWTIRNQTQYLLSK